MTAMVLLSEWMESQVEFWMPVAGFPGYDVSSKGRVRSSLASPLRGSRPPLVLSPATSNWGYLRLSMVCVDGKRRTVRVHRLVANAFIPNPNNLEQVNHKNAVKTDNRLGNLEHSSRSQNIKHAYSLGLFGLSRSGENNKTSKLTTAQVLDILHRGRNGYRQGAALAREYGLDKSVINKILAGKAWKHLQSGG